MQLGLLIGTHLLNSSLNNFHPVLEIKDSILIYQNSFERTSFALFHKVESESLSRTYSSGFTLRAGVTTGYNKQMGYKGVDYEVPLCYNGLTPFIVPAYEIRYDRARAMIAVMADSMNFGVTLEY